MAETKTKQNPHLILVPSPGIGHLAPALEFANLLINRVNHLSVTVLGSNYPLTPSSNPYIHSILSSHSQIHLIVLPDVEPPPQELQLIARELYLVTYIESLLPHVKAAVQSILSSEPVAALVLDFFCVSMVDIGEELGIPSYLFMTSNMGFLSFMLSLQDRRIDNVFDESDPDLAVAGISELVPVRVLPVSSLVRNGGYAAYHRLAQRFRDTKGIIVNTYLELEVYAIDALSSDGKTPPIYPVGPLIDLKGQHNPDLDRALYDGIMKWLDEQPASSVVFLCFGSRGSLGPSQTREIASGLKRSGVRFLWAMRSPPAKDDDGEKALPEGFLEWMEGRGMICEWAPQVDVLAHKAIGGFVSHCGWNSILESLWFGVPTMTWPIYAEQHLNAFRMARESGLAVELTVDYKGGRDLVMADEIEKGLKYLMDGDNAVRKKVQEMKESARKAVVNGGSSFVSVGELIGDMIGSNC